METPDNLFARGAERALRPDACPAERHESACRVGGPGMARPVHALFDVRRRNLFSRTNPMNKTGKEVKNDGKIHV